MREPKSERKFRPDGRRPQRPEAACEAEYRQWRRAVDRARSWIENEV